MSTVTCSINAVPVTVPAGTSILDAATQAGIHIPSLCYLKDINCVGSCRMCLVEIQGKSALVAACTTPVEHGMEVQTSTPEIERIRLQNLQLICSNHRQDCSRCSRFPYCELHTLCREYGIDDKENMFSRKEELAPSPIHLVRDHSKCIQCYRCVSICGDVQGIHALQVTKKGMDARVVFVPNAETTCINCGQCISVCPTAALTENSDCRKVGVALAQRKKHVVAILTKEAAAQIGEYFGACIDAETSIGKAVSALRRLGFRAVFPADPFYEKFLQDLHTEFLQHEQTGTLPVISTRCPSVKKYCDLHYPELRDHISLLDNPLITAAKQCKRFYAKNHSLDPSEIDVVTISSCTADKYERTLPEHQEASYAALTSHEAFMLFERACVSSFSAHQVWNSLPQEDYDCWCDPTQPFKNNETCSAKSVPVSAMKEVDALLQKVKNKDCDFALLELLACPGGCINGAGRSRNSKRPQANLQRSIIDPE